MLDSRIFRISLVLLVWVGVLTTSVAQACWCEEHRICRILHGLQHETEVGEKSTRHRCCWAAGSIVCVLEELCDMAGFSTSDHREKGSDPTPGATIILSDYLFNNHPFAYLAQTPCGGATSKASAIHLQNRSLLL